MVYLTRRERFNAAHRLYKAEWDDAKNYEVFGKCSHPNWHGHNYELYVTIKGNLNPETGFVINLKVLSKIIRERVIEKLDHKNLNLDIDFLKGKITTAENIAIAIWEQIHPALAEYNTELHCVKVVETENNSVEYYG